MFETDSTALDPTVDRCNVQRLPLTNETEPHEKRQSRPRLFTDKLRPDSVSVDVACTLMVRWSGCISHLNEACGNAGDTPSRVLLSTRVPAVPNCGYEAQRSKGGQPPSWEKLPLPGRALPLSEGPAPHCPCQPCPGSQTPLPRGPRRRRRLAVFHTQDHNHSRFQLISRALLQPFLDQQPSQPGPPKRSRFSFHRVRAQQTPVPCAGCKGFPLIFSSTPRPPCILHPHARDPGSSALSHRPAMPAAIKMNIIITNLLHPGLPCPEPRREEIDR